MAENLKPGIDYIGISTPFYCNNGEGSFLLHKRGPNARDEQDNWDFGGGQLDFGEKVEEGVLREVEEEWGVRGEIQEQLPAHSILRQLNGTRTHWLVVPFFVKVDIDLARIMEPNKFTDMGIFQLGSLPTPLHSGAEQTMKRYSATFKKYEK